MERDAGCELTFALDQQQAALWWSVVTGKLGEFFIEVLETETEAEGLRVLQK